MQLFSIDTELFKLDGGAVFGVVPKTIWSRKVQPDDNNLVTLAMRLLLIQDGKRLILIDTGIGNKQDEKFFSYYYLNKENTLEKSLAKYGFSKDDITDVILTHLHFDHAGGAVDLIDGELLPACKNATYWSNQTHWQWASNPNSREKPSFLKENFEPLMNHGKIQFIDFADGKQAVFSENITLRLVNGHTEAMMLPVINYNGKTIVFTADLLISTYHIPVNYVAAYDVAPLQSMQEKSVFLQEALENNYILFFEHDAETECCTLQKTEKGIGIKETFKLTDITNNG